MANPRMMEPILQAEIQCTEDAKESVFLIVGKRRGHIVNEQAKAGSPLYTIKVSCSHKKLNKYWAIRPAIIYIYLYFWPENGYWEVK